MKSIIAPVIAAISIASTVTASPLQARSCQYTYQPTLWNIAQHVPETTSPAGNTINISQDIGRRDLLASFSIPAGSTGPCQLEFDYQPNHGAYVWGTGNPQQINVFAINGALPAAPTWDNVAAPVTGSLVGTFNFPTGADLNTPKVIVINSFGCQANMNFRFAVANTETVKGGVYDVEDATSGFRVSHNC
jgi:hypothetical protein